MSLLRKLGVGSEKIIAQNNRVRGFVTSSETVDGTEFTGGRFFDAFSRSPQAGEVIDVCVDGGSPLKYAIQVQ